MRSSLQRLMFALGVVAIGCAALLVSTRAAAEPSGGDGTGLREQRVETGLPAGFTPVLWAPKGGMFPGQASLMNLAGERNGDMVVKSPVAIPVSLQPVGNFASFPGSMMGSLAYVRQVWLDTEWSTKAQAIYEKNPRGIARPPYDRTEEAPADALQDHP